MIGVRNDGRFKVAVKSLGAVELECKACVVEDVKQSIEDNDSVDHAVNDVTLPRSYLHRARSLTSASSG